MDKLLNTLNDYLHQATGVITQYAPQVWHATLDIIRIQSIVYLSLYFIALSALVGIEIYLQKIKPSLRNDDYEWSQSHQTILQWILGSILGVIWFLYFALNCVSLILGVVNPQLYLLYNLAQKAGLL